MQPTDRYLVLNPQGQPVFSSPDVRPIVLWFWGLTMAPSPAVLEQAPWTVLDYERPFLVRCPLVNCLGRRLGDPWFARAALCPACAIREAPPCRS